MYLRDKQRLYTLAFQAVDEINQLQTKTSTDLSDYTKVVISDIQSLSTLEVMPVGFKKMQSDIEQLTKIMQEHGVIYGNHFSKSSEILLLYAHLSALDDTLRRSTERLVTRESTDEEAKAHLITKFDNDFYSIYRKRFDLFETGTFSYAGQYWWTLTPGAGDLFFVLGKFGKGYREWQEKQEKQHSP
jgi:ABC-type thiamine transport system ATPase subunit